ncbi:MAG: amino acid decarboxylase, partial [Bacteroidetes bacterium]|nr:amino acid decarboxylase [Bacteroidota bacterium]
MNKLKQKIEELEKISMQLEPSAEERKKTREKVVDYTENFINNIYNINAFNLTDNTGEGLLETPISEEPIDIDKAIELFKDNVDFPNLNPASGGHLGYIPGGGIYNSALGDYLADITNRFSGLFYTGPGAVRMENMLIRWMAKIVGFPPETVGNLASGGSIANLIAIVTARDAFQLKATEIGKSVIYLSQEVHHCIDKAIRIAGLGECKMKFVDLDDNYRIKADAVKKEIEKDKKDGRFPWLIIASAGTTDFGVIDPLDELSE